MKDNSANNAFDYIKSAGGIDEYRLKSNGFTVLLMEDHSAPVATFMVTYHVGSRNEAVGYTGATHILEHMMFKGSKEYNREKGTRVAEVLQNLGAQMNATTWMDRTNYFELLPSEHLEVGIKVEADRMRNAFIRDEDRQAEMTVVRNEFENGENEPFTALDKNIWATAYQAHPYHHPTIGWRDDIENVSTERLKEFYNTYYWPNNATATVIGDFDTEKALEMIKKHFGQYPRSPHEIPGMYTSEPKQEGPRRLEINRAGQTGIVGIAHKIPDGRNPDIYPIQILSNILGGGKSSRLYRKLVDAGLATNLFMWDFAFHDNGLFATYVFLTPGTDHSEIEKIVLTEYAQIVENGVTDSEIKKAQAQLRADVAFSRDGSFSIASSINEAIAIGDWTLYTSQLEHYNQVTAADVRRVAREYLVKGQSTTGWFVPEPNGPIGAINPSAIHQPQPWQPSEKISVLTIESNQAGGSVSDGATLASQIVEKEIINGLRLFTMNNGVRDVVTINGSFLGGDVYSPKTNPFVADLTAAMLDQGTVGKTKYAISDALESVGASINFSSGNYRVRFSARCLSMDISLVISLLAEQLREPAFNEDDLDNLKKRIIGELERARENPQQRAQTAFLQGLYPEGHPNYHYDIDREIAFIEQLSVADLAEFHNHAYGLGSFKFVAVGDIKNHQLADALKKGFGDWRTSELESLPEFITANAKKMTARKINIPDKTSVDTFIGQAIGIDRNHQDYYPLMMGLYILGGNFSARLMSTVRDQQGLTYGISAGVAGVENNNDGYWFTWGTFAPNLLEAGRQATLEQLELLIKSGVSELELKNKQTTITGAFKVGLATTRGIAGQVLINAERGRKLDYLDRFPKIINGIALTQVNQTISKYLNLDQLLFVAAGSFEDDNQTKKKP
ncbi:MAG: insulinase family protein [Candidatus Marinimicrobia bacterium]|nr:insulinase family protein [Candidatus Neomarinimicrobiota bacterium]